MILIDGVRAAQATGIPSAFEAFFKKEAFDVIVEIGTLYGGFSVFLRDQVGSEIPIHTFDITPVSRRAIDGIPGDSLNQRLDDSDITQHIVDAVSMKGVEQVLRCLDKGRALIMCDGGNKVKEINLFLPLLRPDDVIMAHDYGKTAATFSTVDWPAHEIQWSDVSETASKTGFESTYEDLFAPVVWLCLAKK
jgi:hypothetical protein